MSDSRSSALSARIGFFRRGALLASVSAAALLMTNPVVQARPLGSQGGSPSQAAIAAAQSASQEAFRAAQQASNGLRRATQAIQAMQAAQQAARNLPPSNVPNGLRPGGLVVMPGATPGATDGGAGLWQGANLPTETQAGGRTQVTVKQNEQKAILTWKEFNVGRETDLYFDQRAAGADAKNWIALNRVMDPGTAPSKILGSIKAEGQVYVINRNGIIFGAGSQVNVGALVASSLGLSNQQFMAGINKPLPLQGNLGDNGAIIMPQFGYLGQRQPNSNLIDHPSQVPGVVIGDAPGDVRVEAGGQITAAGGGKVMLFAPKVFNSGHISAPDGQVIMAAGEQVWLTSSATVRGLDVAVSAPMRWMFAYTQLMGAVGRIGVFDQFTISLRDVILPEMKARAAAVGYTVVNDGVVEADRGNITVMARDIVQNGALLAMTALNNREGSIRLRAWDQGMACSTSSYCELGALKYWSTGTLTLAPGSVTATMPDLSDASEIEKAALEKRYKPGQIDLQAAFINIESEANVVAPAGTINLVGRAFKLSDDLPEPRDGSRIYIGENAYLSVAGLLDISVAMERNIVEAELRINELRDTPLYRDSWLRGMKVRVDRRASGMFTDGPMSGVQWGGSAGEWFGTPLADVSAWIGNGKTDLGELSTVGGSITIATSGSLITRAGSVLDVSGGSVRYRDGWVDTTKLLGADGRTYDIGRAPSNMVFVGLADGFTRSHGRAGVTESWTSSLSRGRRFEKGYTEGRNAGSIQMSAAEGIVLEGSYWGGVVVGERQAAAGNSASAGALTFGGASDELKQYLFGKLVISNTPVRLPTDFTATTPLSSFWYAGGTEAFRARTTYLDADTLAQSGLGKVDLYVAGNFELESGTKLQLNAGSSFSVSANTVDRYTQDFRIDGAINIAGGTVKLLQAENVSFGAGASIDVSGQRINSVIDGMPTRPPIVNGGKVEIMNGQFDPGVVIDVSGGGWYRSTGRKTEFKAGNAGQITLRGVDAAQLSNINLRAYAIGSGGSLTVETMSSLQLGGGATAGAQAVRLPETLFAERGFSTLEINTTGNIVVPAGVTIAQVPLSVDVRGVDLSGFASGAPIISMGRLAVLPLAERIKRAPTSLKLTGAGIKIETGAVVSTDVRGSIALATRQKATAGIEILGRLDASAGEISLVSEGQTIHLGASASLLARGAAVIEADVSGYRSGVVLGGGSVAIDAGFAALDAGSLIDVSGTAATIDPKGGSSLQRRQPEPVTIASDAGAITVAGRGMIANTWRGNAGGAGARGGRITLGSAIGGPVIVSDTAAGAAGLILRQSALQGGGFDDFVASSNLRLENADLAFGGSIKITQGLQNGGGADSRLSATYISLTGIASAGGALSGTLTLAANLIDIMETDIRGFARTMLDAAEIRFRSGDLAANPQNNKAHLYVDGLLTLKAGQVYPSTDTVATIRATDKIVILQNGAAAAPLSVGGVLTLEAPVIEQRGTLRAPFGQIVLKASQQLILGAGSMTSVTSDGLVLPYGNLSNNEHWTGVSGPLTSLPEKRITLDAPKVNLAEGATVDIRGGGDLFAWEHVPGPGGSHDVLTRPGMYAIVPALANSTAPADASLRAGDRIWLDGGGGLAAGWYMLLPARYALLPGAYAIQVVAGSQGSVTAGPVAMTDGSTIVSGYRGNVNDGSRDQLRSSWRLLSGDVVRKYSEYNEAFANEFFASDSFKLTQYRLTGKEIVTPRLPIDGGSLVLKATEELLLDGKLRSQPGEGGRGGLVDIAAEKIAIVGKGQDRSGLGGYLVIDPINLSEFGAGSLLLGGYRSGDALGLKVDVIAKSIVVRNGASSALTGAEIILAASDAIDIGAGSVVAARGNAPVGAGDLVIAPQTAQVINNNGTPDNPSDDFVQTPSRDWGALIRLSNGDAVRVRRENVDTTVGGRVVIGAGAVLDGGKALLVDATRDVVVAGAKLSGASLSLASGRIGLGGGSGLVLDSAALAALGNTQHLTLRSYSSIDFHSAVDLSGLQAVTFDTAALVGYGTRDIEVVGNRLVLENTAAKLVEPAGAGHGSLSLVANELVIGNGAKALRGFDSIKLTGTAQIVGEGNGTLDAGSAAVTLSAPVLTGRGGASQSMTTGGVLTVAAIGPAPARDQGSMGARWSLTGSSIAFGGRIGALGGAVSLTATNGDVVLAGGSSIDVGGFAKQFFDVAAYADAGRISLTALNGKVSMQSGAVLDLSGHAEGGGAGTLAVASGGTGPALNGTINAQAAAGARGGTFSLDIAALADFAALNQRLNLAGFTESRQFRIRTGSVVVDGVTTVRDFRLATDQGAVTITGTVDARNRYGGQIAIYGGNGLAMTSTAVLRAGATDTVDGLGSGRVTLGITGGALAVQGGLIDVGGGEGGKVTLRAPVIEQPGADTVNVTFAGNISGAREIMLEGFKRFDLADLATRPGFVGVTINGKGQAELDLAAQAAGKLNVLADYGAGTLVQFVRDFDISAAYAGLGSLAAQGNFHARPGMELNYAGDIVLKSNWNLGAGTVNQAAAIAAGVMAIDPLMGKAYVVPGQEGRLLRDYTTMVYRTGGSILGEAGVLTLRAEGNVELKGSISDGFFQFADTFDAKYNEIYKTKATSLLLVLNGGRNNTTSNLTPYSNTGTTLPSVYAGISFSTQGIYKDQKAVASPVNAAPFNAAANTPAATAPNELGNAVLLPSITKTDGTTVAASSWSETLVAGATPAGQSADPARRAAGTAGSIILTGQPSISYVSGGKAVFDTTLVDIDPGFNAILKPNATGAVTAASWLSTLETAAGTRLNADSSAVLNVGTTGEAGYTYLMNLWNAYAAAKGITDYKLVTSASRVNIVTKYSIFADFYTKQIIPNLRTIALLYSNAADMPTATMSTSAPITAVRTGTGDIAIAANGDIKLNGAASIYTAGRRDMARLDDFTTAPDTAVFGVGGGHLQVAAGGNIEVTLPADHTQMQHYTEWLKKQGATDKSYAFVPFEHSGLKSLPARQSAWWIDYGNFERGLGALGGGNVAVSAGGDLVNLLVALPTNGRVRGGRSIDERKLLEVRNGGSMSIEAGGAIKAGYYYVGRGAGTIEAAELDFGRTVTVRVQQNLVTTYPIAPILSLGDATLDVHTAGDLRLQTMLDPLLVGKGELYEMAYMSGQTDRTALSLTSAGGDIMIVGQAKYLSKDVDFAASSNAANIYARVNNLAGNLYPSKVRITALNGSVINGGQIYTLPGTSPELRILAGNDVAPGEIIMSRATPAMIPSPLEPVGGDGSPIQLPSWYDLHIALYNYVKAPADNLSDHPLHLFRLSNPEHLPNENDYEPSRIYALSGSIIGSRKSLYEIDAPRAVTTNEATWFRAGMDIRGIDSGLRNIRATDVSLLEAGNDIIGSTIPDLQRPFPNGMITIEGPGALVLSAGRDVYGKTLELYSTGNRRYDRESNRPINLTEVVGLPSQGAAITVMAGLKGKQPSYDPFVEAYLDPANVAAMPDYLKTTVDGKVVPIYLTDAFETRKSGSVHKTRTGLVSFIAEVTGEKLSPLDAWAKFQTLPQVTRERFVRQAYMQELRESGIDQNTPGPNDQPLNGGYNRGYAAIEKLFPGQDWKGNVMIDNAMFRTMSGGDIEVLTPGGGLQVAALGATVDSGYGLVTLGRGDINLFTRDNVTVNRSRILTFAGGDEIIWSTMGDIDAGRGAKTARVPSAPEIVTDFNGVTKVLERADISGSGIGTIIGFTGVEEGDVNLIAPRGTVNAGDAGIRVSGNFSCACFIVLNVDNIKVGGEIKGLPKQAASVAPLTLETKDKAAADAVKDVTQQATPSDRPSVIIVEVLGFGGGGSDAPTTPSNQDESRQRSAPNEQRSQDPDSAYQVLGAGQMTAEEARQAIAERRRASGGR